jgi:hypothetical protein
LPGQETIPRRGEINMPNVIASFAQFVAALVITGLAATAVYAVMDGATRFII